jgi:hypothetical protein
MSSDIDIQEEELYNRAFFRFTYKGELVNAVFEPFNEDGFDYLYIVFTESASHIENIEVDLVFQQILSDILFRFDKGQKLRYRFQVTC